MCAVWATSPPPVLVSALESPQLKAIAQASVGCSNDVRGPVSSKRCLASPATPPGNGRHRRHPTGRGYGFQPSPHLSADGALDLRLKMNVAEQHHHEKDEDHGPQCSARIVPPATAI